ncbi:F-box DNA helicase 1-like [Penaeus chinensis]|uniref:F-box DNA helicase 1-like n=1 Tax=Penaeus chinensis TaxID=139456 RepID=UPI001FB70BC6|nr:F-box DNA helicase 1-like [Penaeus chinensis]
MAEVFGGSSSWALPAEILEMVLAQLPLPALLTVHSTVCHYWSGIIMNPAFIPWKKIYHRLKQAPASLSSAFLLSPSRAEELVQTQDIVKELCVQHHITSLEDCLISIIRLMGNSHGIPFESKATIDVLKRHPLYKLAVAALDFHGQDLIPERRNVWHIVSMIVVLAKDMWQVDALLQLLLSRGSVFTPRDITEAFYCMSTFFLHCTREYELPTRYHYIVNYALYLYENRWTLTPADDPGRLKQSHCGQQSLQKFMSYKPKVQHTHEQMRIINHDIKPDHIVKIVAFAGTGKTTTLLQMCQQRPHQKFLLVVYNKSVEEHCSKSFPTNVKVRTAHAMAFANVGRRFLSIRRLDGNLSSSKISEFLEQKEGAGNRFRRAALVKNTIEIFLNSHDDILTLQHVPVKDKDQNDIEDDYRLKILLSDAEAVWKEMKQCSPTQKIAMSQDGQLKCWQLSKPRLQGYDVIMIDEGQDMNTAMFDIFLRQKCAKVIVGDPHQQIYSFRGAVNALQMVPATHTYYLTQSFRFGPEISYVANCSLEVLKNVQKQTLVGGRKQDFVYVSSKSEPVTSSGKKLSTAYLARMNLTIYKLSISMCLDDKYSHMSMSFAGGLAKYGFDTVLDIYKLWQIQQGFGTAESLGIKNKLIAKFKSVFSLRKFADNIDDHDLSNKIRMFDYSGTKTPYHLQLLNRRCNGEPSRSDIVFSTIHKSKGLEFDWVIMLDDLVPVNLPYQNMKYEGDEHNLMYVAVTRAKLWLTINSAVLYTLTAAREKFEVITGRQEVDPNHKCTQCGEKDIANSKTPLVTKVITVPIGNQGERFRGGYLCENCTTFNKYVPPMTIGHEYGIIKLLKDSSRLCRRTLLTGKKEFNDTPENRHMHLGWQQYHSHSEADSNTDEEFPDDIDFEDPALLVLEEEAVQIEQEDNNEVVPRRAIEPEVIQIDDREPEVIQID